MNFLDKVTGNDMTREMKDFEQRAKILPADYQTAWESIKANLWQHSDITGRNLMPVFEGVLCLLEETSADGQTAKQALGDDINGFCAALIGEDGANTFRDKWRRQLNSSIAKKLGKQEK